MNHEHLTPLSTLYAADEFPGWFARVFGLEVPVAFDRYRQRNPVGMRGRWGRMFPAAEVIAVSASSDIVQHGMCFVGVAASQQMFMLRARDGKIFVVNGTDHRVVTATFSDMVTCLELLGLDS
jgi:hypothetical protein